MEKCVYHATSSDNQLKQLLNPSGLECIKGESPQMVHVRKRLQDISLTDAPVLVYGETGTGKELVAQALHGLSARADMPFIAVNCGAYPNDLILNELFGHERGAYTGAVSKHEGLVSAAEGGVLFLDEIDSLSPSAQVVLLRFLQDKSYRPLGGAERKADVRIVSATHCDLPQKVKKAAFRSDLFYRLDVLRVNLAPLRERREDITTLFHYFSKKFALEHGVIIPDRAEELEDWMLNHEWPGNVRELESVVLRWLFGEMPEMENLQSSTVEQCESVELRHLARKCAQRYRLMDAKNRVSSEFEKHYVAYLMKCCEGNISRAAKLAGKERRAFGKLVKKYSLK